MKKILLLVLALFVILLACVYIFIPAEIKISAASTASCIPRNIADCFRQELIKRWWPGNAGDSLLSYKNSSYYISERFSDGASIMMTRENKSMPTKLTVVQSGKDSSWVEWTAVIKSSLNPFSRIGEYFQAVEMKKEITPLLGSLVNFAQDDRNIYGFSIERTTFTDSVLYATKFFSATEPSLETVYTHVAELRRKIGEAGAAEKNFPMLNVNQIDGSHYESMIAIAVDRPIAADKGFFLSRMVPMKDRFLKTTATGGAATVRNAHAAIQSYMNDRFLSAPAISFDILVTDRSKEPDTAKWKTIIFQPSM